MKNLKVFKKNILILSPYEDDLENLIKYSEKKYNFNFFSHSLHLIKHLDKINTDSVIIISSKIEDHDYINVVKQILNKLNSHKIIVLAELCSVAEVSLAMKSGVYHVSVGKNLHKDTISCLDKFFHELNEKALTKDLNKVMESNLLMILENLGEYFSPSFSKDIGDQYCLWKKSFDESFVEKLLIVEDEIMYLDFLKEILSKKYHINGVSNAQSALKKVNSSFFPVMLVDLFLPDKDGAKLVEELKILSPLSEIIVITAFDMPDSASEIFELGIHSYLNKPLLKEKLFESILSALEVSKQNVIKDNSLKQFFPNELTFEQKLLFIKSMFKQELLKNDHVFIEDIMCFFPELKLSSFPNKMLIPSFDNDDQLETYVRGLINI